VLSLDVSPGEVTASVQGSRPRPYTVSIGLAVLSERTWSAVEAALAAQALFSARLLAGEMPGQIEEVFAGAGAALFPTSANQLAMHCSCPDWTVPCKHIAATFYLLAEAFDADPFQILHWRGRDRDALLARLRALRSAAGPDSGDAGEGGGEGDGDGDAEPARGGRGRADRARATARRPRKAAGSPAEPATPGTATPDAAVPETAPVTGAALALAELTSPDLAETVERFWVAPVPLPARPPTLDTDVDLLLRQLPPPAPGLGGAELVTGLRILYTAFAAPQDPLDHDVRVTPQRRS
jgi:uncharacterized Zn finger protein